MNNELIKTYIRQIKESVEDLSTSNTNLEKSLLENIIKNMLNEIEKEIEK